MGSLDQASFKTDAELVEGFDYSCDVRFYLTSRKDHLYVLSTLGPG